MKIEEALARYVTQLEADGRSHHTIHQYQRHVGLLAAWLRERGDSGKVEEVDHETLALFLASPAARTRPDGKTKKANSTNALRTSLRTFFRYTHEAGYAGSNAARLVRRALCGAAPPRALSEEEQGRLLVVLSEGRGSSARRDYALFALMLRTGVRLGSALALEVGDVDLERGDLRIRKAKGDVPTTVPISRAVRDHLRGYIDGRGDGPLFPGHGGLPMCARHAQRRLAMACERAGILRHVSPHALRHSYATQLYRRTRDLLLVQLALRHRSIASTTIYARCEEGRLRDAIAIE